MSRPPAETVGAALAEAARRLAGAGVEEPRREARRLLALAENRTGSWVGRDERPLAPAVGQRFADLVARRAAREPFARLAGEREFWSLPFRLSAATLVPRPETETLVEAALAHAGRAGVPRRLLDLGTGSGCLLLALLAEWPDCWGVGMDVSAAALRVARDNACALGLDRRAAFACGDWGQAVAGGFDLVVANPPYLAAADWAALAPEVALHEPRLALAGGTDGLDAYRALAADAERLLAPGGRMVVEIGRGQAPAVARLFAARGLPVAAVRCDLGGIERCLEFAGSSGSETE